MLTSVRTLYPWAPAPPPPVPTPSGGGQDRYPAGPGRQAQEMMIIAMHLSGAITEEEMVALLAGL